VSEIKLDLIVVNDLNGQLQRLKRSLADVGGDVASAGVSGAVAARRSIGSRLDSTAQRLGRVEAELAQLYTCIAGAIERYRQAEADVVRQSERLQDIRVSDASDGGWWSVAKATWNESIEMLEQKAAGFWDEVDERIEEREQAVGRVEAKVVGWIGEGQQLVEEWIEKGAYNEQHKGIAEQWIDGTVLDNQYVHELLDIMDQGRQLSSHFEAGVARGLVDTVASVLEASVASAAEFAKHDPVMKTIKAVEYGAEVASSDHPLEKVETDAWQAGQEAVSVVKNSVEGVKNAVVDTVHEFENSDGNHRADMLGYGLEKAAELFAGGAVLKSALTAEKAAAEAAKLRSTVIANIDESKAAREASRFSEYVKSERQMKEELAAKRDAAGNRKITEPSLPKRSKPQGNYGIGDFHGVTKQNQTANLLADQGYDVHMLDEVNGGNGYGISEGSNPDFLIEGNVFDCYAPKPDGKVQSIIKEIAGKTKSQSGRIVLNLDDFPQEKVNEIIDTVLRKANVNGDLKRLEELLLVKDGKITRVFGG